jgi:hypothetical protein
LGKGGSNPVTRSLEAPWRLQRWGASFGRIYSDQRTVIHILAGTVINDGCLMLFTRRNSQEDFRTLPFLAKTRLYSAIILPMTFPNSQFYEF